MKLSNLKPIIYCVSNMTPEVHKSFAEINSSEFIKEAKWYKGVAGLASSIKKKTAAPILNTVPAKNIASIEKSLSPKGNVIFEVEFKDIPDGKTFEINAMVVIEFDDEGKTFRPVLVRSFDPMNVTDNLKKMKIEIPKVFLKVEEMGE